MTLDRTQRLMDGAYDRWQTQKDTMTRQEFWDQLDADERVAVFLGNLNYQVENGGFSQWLDNGYATLETVGFIGRTCVGMCTASSMAVHGLLCEFEAACGGTVDVRSGEYTESYADFDRLGALDSRYYAVHEAFMADVESMLSARAEARYRAAVPADPLWSVSLRGVATYEVKVLAPDDAAARLEALSIAADLESGDLEVTDLEVVEVRGPA
jgi:hypothetical protein